MKRIKADLSEGELKDLENRFAARSSSPDGNGGVARSTAAGRGGGSGTAAAAEGVRYVELLHWGAPRREPGDGDDEVGLWVYTELNNLIHDRVLEFGGGRGGGSSSISLNTLRCATATFPRLAKTNKEMEERQMRSVDGIPSHQVTSALNYFLTPRYPQEKKNLE